MSQAKIDNSTLKEVHDGLSELESPILRLRNLAYAARMLASSDEMPKEPGAALDSVADTLVEELQALSEERERLWQLCCEAKRPDVSSEAEAA